MKWLSALMPALWFSAKKKDLADDVDMFRDKLMRLGGNLNLNIDRIADPTLLVTPTKSISKEDAMLFDWRKLGDLFWNVGQTPEARRLAGAFYTPERIIDTILDHLWNDIAPNAPGLDQPVTICDPAMGCGFFHLRLIDRLLAAGIERETVRQWSDSALYGVDLDAESVFLARIFLWLSLSDRDAEFIPRAEHFRQGDSLLGPAFAQKGRRGGLEWTASFPEIAASEGFSVIFGNPPYEVLTNFSRYPDSRRRAEALRTSGWYEASLQGQINLYRCFIERSLDLLQLGGRLGFVVPLSLARDGTAAAMRMRLLTRERARDWHLFSEGDALFRGVTQSACVFTATRDGGDAETVRVRSWRGDARLAVTELRNFSGNGLAIPDAGRDDLRLWRWIRKNIRTRLGDFVEMRVGEVDQTVYRDCMLDDDSGCILARGAHIQPFWLDVQPTPGHERFLDEAKFLAKKCGSGEACRRRANEWRIAQLGIRNMRTRPRLVAALAPPGTYLGNSLNVYYPLDGVNISFFCGLLNSRLLDWMFCLGSGNNNINLREMAALPCPSPYATGGDDTIAGIARAFDRCRLKADKGRKFDKEKRELDLRVEAFYRIPEKLRDLIFAIG